MRAFGYDDNFVCKEILNFIIYGYFFVILNNIYLLFKTNTRSSFQSDATKNIVLKKLLIFTYFYLIFF